MRYIAIGGVSIVLVVAACAELSGRSRTYAEPTSGDTARVRFVTNGGLHLIPAHSCVDWSEPNAGALFSTNIGGSTRFTGRKIGIPGEAPAGFTFGEAVVPAGKPLSVVFSSLILGQASCDYNWAFVPKANEDYEVKVWHDSGSKLCRFEPRSLTQPTQRVSISQAKDC